MKESNSTDLSLMLKYYKFSNTYIFFIIVILAKFVPGYQNYGQCQVGLGIDIQNAVCKGHNLKNNHHFKIDLNLL